jgi:tetratricopeptide (TPR) repeat protein
VLAGADVLPELWDPVEARLDDYAKRWIEARATLCDPVRTPSEIDAAWLCLRARREAFDTFTRIVSTGDRTTLLEASAAVEGLEHPERCLTAGGSGHSRGDDAREIEVATAEVTTRLTLHAEGGVAMANALLDEARAAGLCEVEVTLQTALAREETRAGAFQRAVDRLELAYYAGTRCDPGAAAIAAGETHRLLATELQDPDTAALWLGHARAMAERSGDTDVDVAVAIREAEVAARAGDLQRALRLFERVWSQIEPTAERRPRLAARVLTGLGTVYRRLRNLDAAERAQERGLVFLQRSAGEMHPDVAAALNGLANVQATRGRFGEAAATYARALAVWRRIGDDVRVAFSIANVAIVQLKLRQSEEALAGFDAALERLVAAYGDHPTTARLRMHRARALARLHRDEEALDEALRALETLRSSPADREWALAVVAEVELVTGHVPQARRRIDEALELCPPELAREECLGHVLVVRGQIEIAEGRTVDAVATLRDAERLLAPGEIDYALTLPEAVAAALRTPRGE